MLPPERAYELARLVLDAVVDRYGADGDDGDDLPARRYVADGATAWDCSDGHVAVQVTSIFPNLPGLDGPVLLDCGVTYSANLTVSIIRCAPGTDQAVRPVEDMETNAQLVLADPARVFDALVAAYADGDLPCSGVVFVAWNSRGPDGGLVGGDTLLRVSLLDG